ncbi:hypothetical protein POP15_228 [Pectobacterium phage POP15]|nr:hypothetical protein POP15_228 [Pectobacterium phage POP15]
MENTIVTSGRVKSIVEKLESHKDVSKVLMLCLAGSHAYGTATPTSDTDIRGIIVAKPGVIRAPFRTLREMGIEDEEDGKVYELNNFMELFCDMNPNIIELGFTDEQATLYSHPAWDDMKTFLPQLLNRNVAFRFGGYAMAQLKRIKGHNKHINNPLPEAAPTQLEFFRLVQSYLDVKVLKHEDFMRKLSNMEGVCTLIPFGADIYGVVPDHREDVGPMFNPDGSIRKLKYEDIPDAVKKQAPLFIVKYLRQDHMVAKDKHHNYWQWVKNRNPARHELEEKFGYDTKHAMHLVRLLRMGQEILELGEVRVRRPDAEELLGIRNGTHDYEDIVEWADGQDKLIRDVLYKESKLPKNSNKRLAEDLILSVQDAVWSD